MPKFLTGFQNLTNPGRERACAMAYTLICSGLTLREAGQLCGLGPGIMRRLRETARARGELPRAQLPHRTLAAALCPRNTLGYTALLNLYLKRRTRADPDLNALLEAWHLHAALQEDPGAEAPDLRLGDLLQIVQHLIAPARLRNLQEMGDKAQWPADFVYGCNPGIGSYFTSAAAPLTATEARLVPLRPWTEIFRRMRVPLPRRRCATAAP